jgi:hypothetical protein
VRGLKVGIVAVGRHGEAFSRIGRAHRGLRGDHLTGQADRVCTAKRSASGRSKAEDGRLRLFPRGPYRASVRPRARQSEGTSAVTKNKNHPFGGLAIPNPSM